MLSLYSNAIYHVFCKVTFYHLINLFVFVFCRWKDSAKLNEVRFAKSFNILKNIFDNSTNG